MLDKRKSFKHILHATFQPHMTPQTGTTKVASSAGVACISKTGWTASSSADQPPQVQKDLPNPPEIWPIALRPPALLRQCANTTSQPTNSSITSSHVFSQTFSILSNFDFFFGPKNAGHPCATCPSLVDTICRLPSIRVGCVLSFL